MGSAKASPHPGGLIPNPSAPCLVPWDSWYNHLIVNSCGQPRPSIIPALAHIASLELVPLCACCCPHISRSLGFLSIYKFWHLLYMYTQLILIHIFNTIWNKIHIFYCIYIFLCIAIFE